MNVFKAPIDYILYINNSMKNIDYRVTGLTAVNLYGFGISTNVFDLAVESDDQVIEAVKMLELPKPENNNYDPYIYYNPDGFYVKIQGDILGEPVIHPLGFKLHSKELLIKRLDIYSKYDPRVLKALAFIALTLDEEKTEEYKYYWNRL
jgi:hypothetical protein